jgi:hypothetical protein
VQDWLDSGAQADVIILSLSARLFFHHGDAGASNVKSQSLQVF